MNRLLIIDGHNLHFQIFFGIQSRLKKKPGKVSPFGVGFTGAMKRIIRFANPTHVVVIFDGEHENPRRALFPAYKANRPDYSQLPDDENPYLQLPAVRGALDNMKIKYVETTKLEADDMIAVCCEKFRSSADIIVCSHDHDFYQLLGSHVKLMNYSGKQGSYYDEKNFRDEFHIPPRLFADYKALHGDKSDNIPGVRGVGSISAVRLLNRFGGVEEIIAHTPEVRQKKLRRCLVEGVDRMRLNYKLVKLGGEQYDEVELPWTLDELVYTMSDEPKKDNKRHQRPKPGGKPQVNQSGQKPKRNPGQSKPEQAKPEQTAPIPEPKPIEVKAEQTEAADIKPVGSAKPRNKRRRRRPNKPKPQVQQAVQEQAEAKQMSEAEPAESEPKHTDAKGQPLSGLKAEQSDRKPDESATGQSGEHPAEKRRRRPHPRKRKPRQDGGQGEVSQAESNAAQSDHKPAQTETKPQTEPGQQSEPGQQVEPKPKSEPKLKSEPKQQSETKPKSEPKPQVEQKPKSEPKPQAEQKPKSAQTEPKPEPKPEHEAARDSKQPSGQSQKPRKPRQNKKRRDRDDYPRQESAGDRILTRKQAWND